MYSRSSTGKGAKLLNYQEQMLVLVLPLGIKLSSFSCEREVIAMVFFSVSNFPLAAQAAPLVCFYLEPALLQPLLFSGLFDGSK